MEVGQGKDLSKGCCHTVHWPEQLFPAEELTTVVWRVAVIWEISQLMVGKP